MSRSVLDRAVFLGRSLLRLGYVRVTFGALYVASQYSCRTAAARGDSTGAVLGQGDALGLTVSFMTLPGASVLVWYSRIQCAVFACSADRGAPVPLISGKSQRWSTLAMWS